MQLSATVMHIVLVPHSPIAPRRWQFAVQMPRAESHMHCESALHSDWRVP